MAESFVRSVCCPSCGREQSVPVARLNDEAECVACASRFLPARLLGVPSTSVERTVALPEQASPAASCAGSPGNVLSASPVQTAKPIRLEDKLKSDDPAAHDPLIETVLGKVHLKRRLGEGGMGAVYVGHHLTLDVDVAVKVLPPELARRHPAFVERFLREARTAAQIHHPNIVQVYDVDYERGFFFIVMEYVDGETVAERLRRRGRLSEREVVGIGMDAAAALEYARRRKIVHRDVKPENLLISKDGEVKLADLGLAKQTMDETKSGVTMDGQALGTPAFISPEQVANARQADHRSDLYSLGATLFHLATGRPPFQGSTALQTMMLHLNQPAPQLRAYRAELSLELATVVQRLLEKDPAARFQTGREVYAALQSLYERIAPAEDHEDEPLKEQPVTLAMPTPDPTPIRKSTSIWDPLAPVAPAVPVPIPGAPTTPAPAVLPAETVRSQPSPSALIRYPSRWWIVLLALPCLNWLAWLWIGVTGRHAVWMGVGVGVLAAYVAFGCFACEADWLSWAGAGAVYVGALVSGLAVRREYEIRVIELQRDKPWF